MCIIDWLGLLPQGRWDLEESFTSYNLINTFLVSLKRTGQWIIIIDILKEKMYWQAPFSHNFPYLHYVTHKENCA